MHDMSSDSFFIFQKEKQKSTRWLVSEEVGLWWYQQPRFGKIYLPFLGGSYGPRIIMLSWSSLINLTFYIESSWNPPFFLHQIYTNHKQQKPNPPEKQLCVSKHVSPIGFLGYNLSLITCRSLKNGSLLVNTYVVVNVLIVFVGWSFGSLTHVHGGKGGFCQYRLHWHASLSSQVMQKTKPDLSSRGSSVCWWLMVRENLMGRFLVT